MYMKQQIESMTESFFVDNKFVEKLGFFLKCCKELHGLIYQPWQHFNFNCFYLLGCRKQGLFLADVSRSNTVTDNYGVFFFRRAHTITVLVVFCVILVYVTLFEEKTYDADYNNKRFAVIFWFSDEYSVLWSSFYNCCQKSKYFSIGFFLSFSHWN